MRVTVRIIAILAAMVAFSGTATAASLGGWRQTGHATVDIKFSNEGIATVRAPGKPPALVYRGSGAIPQAQLDKGWGHVGDVDSHRGYIVDAYQNTRDVPAPNKMFLVTTPTGQTYEYVHQLTPEEPPANANSAVAITPDGRWLVAAALGELDQLFVFPAPLTGTGGSIELSGHVKLDTKIRNAQGCDFVSERKLLCATSDPYNDLYPTSFQLLEIDLARPVRGQDVRAHVRSLGQVPLVSTCPGLFVTEGVDYDAPAGELRVEVVAPSPCNTVTDVYTFRRS
ncbi:hypothetical protein AB5J62_29010 [Amycolatopsis sp. cg5]|uniref:hypothetical protein n=1 Tax=Amycolatopsis sp. cg5 TaxID=3238802 RepID=UPI003525731E